MARAGLELAKPVLRSFSVVDQSQKRPSEGPPGYCDSLLSTSYLSPGSRTPRGSGACLLRASIASWSDWRRAGGLNTLASAKGKGQRSHGRGPRRGVVSCEFAGEYQECFDDVDKHILDYFTFKGVKTVLAQLHELNPPEYTWFYNFVVTNKPQDSKVFLRRLVQERQSLGERVMVTRLHLFRKWVKTYNHTKMHEAIEKQNLELLRERLMQTVKFDP